MRSFEFMALAADGRTVEGRELAASELQLDRELERRGLTLTRARAVVGAGAAARARLRRDDLHALTTQLATVVAAGVPLVEGLDGIAQRLTRPEARKVVEGLAVGLRDGQRLSEAMERHARSFPFIYRASVRAAEASGALDKVLDRLARYLEWSRTMRATTIQALIYPAILAHALVGLVALLLYFVLPRLVKLFPGGRDSLPTQTRIVLGASDLLRENWIVVLLLVVGSVVAAVSAWRSTPWRRRLHGTLLRVPRLGQVVGQIATSRFAGTAATLQAAGCDVFTTLTVAADSCGNEALRQSFGEVAHAVRRGSTLTQAFERQPLIDPLLTQLVAVGERSGSLDACLERLVAYYDEEIPRRVRRFLALLEPALLLGAGGVVAFILLAALLPVFRLYETLG